jgi:hypothetical protein
LLPPFVGVAVIVTLLPEQTGFCDALILTDGVTVGVTVTVILFDVAGNGVTHAALLDISQVTTLPLLKVVELKVF